MFMQQTENVIKLHMLITLFVVSVLGTDAFSAAKDLQIHEVHVNFETETITILGQGFDVPQDTTVTLGVTNSLLIINETSTTIEVALPDIADGNYLLVVETNGGSSGHDEFDLSILRPKTDVQYTVIPIPDNLVLNRDETATVSTITAARTGLATILFTANISGSGGEIIFRVNVLQNSNLHPGASRGYHANTDVNASMHVTFPVTKGDVIDVNVEVIQTDSLGAIFVEEPIVTVLFNG